MGSVVVTVFMIFLLAAPSWSLAENDPIEAEKTAVEQSALKRKLLIGGFGENEELTSDAPIYISSDSLSLDAIHRTFMYEGSVEAFQNDLLITADVMEGKYDEKNRLDKIVCRSHVVVTRGDRLRAVANRAEFDVIHNTIVLTEGPEIVEGNNFMSADRVTVYLDEDRSEAEGRVRVKLIKQKGGSSIGSLVRSSSSSAQVSSQP